MTQEAFTGDLTGDITNDPLFERKLEAVVEGLAPYFRKCILNFFPENAKLVVDFINSELQYNNIRVLTKKNKIQAVDEFTKFLRKKYGHEIPLKQVGREDFEDFQSSKRKTESIDPLHRWIGTYNQFIRNLKPFYKYVYHSNVPPKERKAARFSKRNKLT
jgi:hypothetical protein